jgi:hypothetical protein
MNHPLRCRCGTIQGFVALPAMTSRAVCHCKDCQAYAHALGQASAVLDDSGGTDIVATLPRQVHFEQGLESLACLSLAEGGLLRWYAACCNTPIGNTPRDHKMSYVGLVHSCLASQPMEASFGSARIHLQTQSATRPVAPTRLPMVLAIFKLMKTMLPVRWNGRYRENPFFDAHSGAPVRPPRVLSPGELAAAKGAV